MIIRLTPTSPPEVLGREKKQQQRNLAPDTEPRAVSGMMPPATIYYCSRCGVYVGIKDQYLYHNNHPGHQFMPKSFWFQNREPQVQKSGEVHWVMKK